jgi:hypothetical protein
MFNFNEFKENMGIFYYIFDDNLDFVKAKKRYVKNEYVKTFSDSLFDEALMEIKMNMGFDKSDKEFCVNVEALDYNIKVEYRINPESLTIKRDLKLLEGEFADSEVFDKCYEAYKNLDKMVTIFIESNFIDDEEVINDFVKKIVKHFYSDNIEFTDISYMDKEDNLTIKSDTVTLVINDFSKLLKGSNLSYNVPSNNPIGNDELEFINKSVRCIEKLLKLYGF